MAVVLITGCRSGIGLETALAFGRRGDRTYATMREASLGAALCDLAEREGLPIVVDSLDVTDGAAVTSMVAKIVAVEGGIDVLVNNAGIPGVASSIEDIDETIGRDVMETNFWAPFRLCRAVLPHMRATGAGVIVNVSTFGVRTGGGVPVLFFYGVSKQALFYLSLALQAEVAATGVRVVDIEPGFFATAIYDSTKRQGLAPSAPYAELVHRVDEAIAGRIASGDDPVRVASAIVAAATDPSTPTCVLVGDDAVAAVRAHRESLLTQWQSEPVPR